jgi:hypothetical protein
MEVVVSKWHRPSRFKLRWDPEHQFKYSKFRESDSGQSEVIQLILSRGWGDPCLRRWFSFTRSPINLNRPWQEALGHRYRGEDYCRIMLLGRKIQ